MGGSSLLHLKFKKIDHGILFKYPCPVSPLGNADVAYQFIIYPMLCHYSFLGMLVSEPHVACQF